MAQRRAVWKRGEPRFGLDSRFIVPARGLIGQRALPDRDGYCFVYCRRLSPWQGAIEQRLTGSLVADRAGQATPRYDEHPERGSFIVEPGSEVYEGQVVLPR